VLNGVREATEYELLGHRIEVYGICPACKASGRIVDTSSFEQHHHQSLR
jgi:hypothetical protein